MIPVVEQLAATWTSIDELCADLSEAEWKLPTGCPGWSVQDNVAHLVDYESEALGRPRAPHEVAELAHIKNDMGARNEIGVDGRRALRGAEVLAELRKVTAARLARLGELDDQDLDRPMATPVGAGTLASLLILRVMDTWSHEQDIRRALGRPGHLTGPAVATAVTYLTGFLPYAVAKLAKGPEGTTAVFVIDGFGPLAVEVVGGRGRRTEAVPDDPTVTLRMGVGDFAALVGGRSDARPEAVDIGGDAALGAHIVANLAFLP
jgi:uncharacterized protein (TIGR03083 family)